LSNTSVYLKQNVPYWPDDDRLWSKHLATVSPIAYNISLYWCCVLTVYNILYNCYCTTGRLMSKKIISSN